MIRKSLSLQRGAPLIFSLMAIGLLCSNAFGADKAKISASVAPAATGDAQTMIETDTGAASSSKKIGLKILFSAGGGAVSDDNSSRNGFPQLSARAVYALKHGISVGARYRALWYDKMFVSTNPVFDGSDNQRIIAGETLQDTQIFIAFNTLFKKSKIIALNVDLAPRFVDMRSKSFSAWSGSARLGGKVIYHASNQFCLFGGGGWSMGFLGNQPKLSLMGEPKQFWDATAGVGIRLSDTNMPATWMVTLGWRADWLVFEHSRSIYQSAFAGLGIDI